MSDRAEILADCATTDEEWSKLRPGMTPWDMSVCVALLASRAKPLADAARDLVAENERLREALTWAVGFIRCNFPNAREQYEDMRNAESLAEAHPLHTGEFQRASARAELAEHERDQLRAALKPFADEAKRRSWMDAAGLTEMRGWNIGGSALTNADLARAAELLAGSPAPA